MSDSTLEALAASLRASPGFAHKRDISEVMATLGRALPGGAAALAAWQRVALAPGESKVVEFTLRANDLRFIGVQNRPVVEPGSFRIWVAPSAEADGVNGSFVLA